jgi:hypothetical protein
MPTSQCQPNRDKPTNHTITARPSPTGPVKTRRFVSSRLPSPCRGLSLRTASDRPAVAPLLITTQIDSPRLLASYRANSARHSSPATVIPCQARSTCQSCTVRTCPYRRSLSRRIITLPTDLPYLCPPSLVPACPVRPAETHHICSRRRVNSSSHLLMPFRHHSPERTMTSQARPARLSKPARLLSGRSDKPERV